jgi:CxxC motif-containing protein (DUF1111 family)
LVYRSIDGNVYRKSTECAATVDVTAGRTRDLVEAIEEHDSRGSEARQVIRKFNSVEAEDQQDLINFLRSL